MAAWPWAMALVNCAPGFAGGHGRFAACSKIAFFPREPLRDDDHYRPFQGAHLCETLPLLAAAGIVPAKNPETSRKLIIGTNLPDVRVVIVRASDVPTYVQYGAADLGVAGRDVLIEHGGQGSHHST